MKILFNRMKGINSKIKNGILLSNRKRELRVVYVKMEDFQINTRGKDTSNGLINTSLVKFTRKLVAFITDNFLGSLIFTSARTDKRFRAV